MRDDPSQPQSATAAAEPPADAVLPHPQPNAPLAPPPEPGRGRLPRLLLFLAVLVSTGIGTVWEHVRAVRAGYRLHALETQRERLHEERRRLEIKKAHEERIDILEERARKLKIPSPMDLPPIEGVGG